VDRRADFRYGASGVKRMIGRDGMTMIGGSVTAGGGLTVTMTGRDGMTTIGGSVTTGGGLTVTTIGRDGMTTIGGFVGIDTPGVIVTFTRFCGVSVIMRSLGGVSVHVTKQVSQHLTGGKVFPPQGACIIAEHGVSDCI
jgi:hypothetical protein